MTVACCACLAAGSVSYLQRVLLMEAPSKTNMKREQLDKAGGPLINNWRPTQEAAGGLLPALAHLTFGEVAELLASDAAVDQDAVNVAGQLCCICAEIYDNEVRSVHARVVVSRSACVRGVERSSRVVTLQHLARYPDCAGPANQTRPRPAAALPDGPGGGADHVRLCWQGREPRLGAG